jgi:uncharacterized protein YoxC
MNKEQKLRHRRLGKMYLKAINSTIKRLERVLDVLDPNMTGQTQQVKELEEKLISAVQLRRKMVDCYWNYKEI